jgi:hypothetical protein
MATAAPPNNAKVLSFDGAYRRSGMRNPAQGRHRPPVSAERAFVPAPEMVQWIRDTFIADDGPLYNPDHQHLEFARFGVVWTGVENIRQQRRILATCEMPQQGISTAWKKARAEQQLEEWFDFLPDFLITLYSELAVFDDRSFCAVIEHELYHAAQDVRDGAPRFHRDGSPMFAIKGHDVEEFFGVAARYGLPGDLKALVDLAKQQPQLPDRVIEGACGTCLARAA